MFDDDDLFKIDDPEEPFGSWTTGRVSGSYVRRRDNGKAAVVVTCIQRAGFSGYHWAVRDPKRGFYASGEESLLTKAKSAADLALHAMARGISKEGFRSLLNRDPSVERLGQLLQQLESLLDT